MEFVKLLLALPTQYNLEAAYSLIRQNRREPNKFLVQAQENKHRLWHECTPNADSTEKTDKEEDMTACNELKQMNFKTTQK